MEAEEALHNLLNSKVHQSSVSVLLHGPSGSGKTHAIRKATCNHTLRTFNPFDLTDHSGSIERSIAHYFQPPSIDNPSPIVILVDHLEIWAPSHPTSPSDLRTIAAFNDHLSHLHQSLVFIATSSTPSAVHPSLIRPGRIHHYIHLNALSFSARRDIFQNWLLNFLPNYTSPASHIDQMARATPGFLPADISRLISYLETSVTRTVQTPSQTLQAIQHNFSTCLTSAIPPFLSTIRSTNLNKNVLHGLDPPIQQIRQCLSAVFLGHTQSNIQTPSETIRAIRSLSPFKGLIIHGPTACGKSSLAHLTQTMLPQNSVNHLVIDATSIVTSVIGESERNLKNIFTTARSIAPAILVMDNVDTIAPCREARENVSHAFNRILSTFLVLLDGLRSFTEPVFVVATTRSLSLLDPALLRPGRFEMHVEVCRPDSEACASIVHDFCNQNIPIAGVEATAAVRSFFKNQFADSRSWTAPEIYLTAREILIKECVRNTR